MKDMETKKVNYKCVFDIVFEDGAGFNTEVEMDEVRAWLLDPREVYSSIKEVKIV